MSNNLVLIDGNAIVHRAYHSMPKTFTNQKGEPTNAIYGFALALIRVIEDLKPEYIVCSFDLAGPTFRHEKFADYKATRVKADQELYDQIPKIKQLVETMGIRIIEKEGFEADDVIGTVVKKIQKEGKTLNSKLEINFKSKTQKSENSGGHLTPNTQHLAIYIVTGDKDTFQLVNSGVFIYDLKQGAGGARIINRQVIKNKYDLEPEDFVDLKALAGDASDNIPGVPGIGDKTATQLLHDFGNLEKLYEAIETEEPKNLKTKEHNMCHPELDSGSKNVWIPDQVRNDTKSTIKPRILDLLIKHKEQAFLSKELATIHCDVPMDFTLDSVKWGEYDKEKLKELFEELGFRSLLRRFDQAGQTEELKNPKTEKPFDSAHGRKKTQIQKKDEQLKLL